MTTLEQQNSIPFFTVPVVPQCIDADLLALPPDSKVRVRTVSCADFGSGVTTARDAIAEIERTMARQATGHFTMAEAADVLAAAHGFDAYDFLQDRMHPAFMDGRLILVDPKDEGSVSGRPCMELHDWATPENVNKWLESAAFPYRWPAPQAAPVEQTPVPELQPLPVVMETTKERRTRYLAMFEAEEKRGKRGALQRLADSEGVDRANMSKDIKKARELRITEKRAGALWTAQLVQDGKRSG